MEASDRCAHSNLATLLGVSIALAAPIAHSAPASSATVYFAHNDAQYLAENQREGGAALFPRGVDDEALPLIVFLHGTNPGGDLHLWLGGGGHDLRPLARRLFTEKKLRRFILAGPSQTRAAGHGRTLWQDFDLSAFVDDVAEALDGRATIDRGSVVFVGHSGAGCNPRGGLATDFWSHGRVSPRTLIAIDPCLDAKLGAAFARRPPRVPLWVMWQSAVWPREPAAFKSALVPSDAAPREDRVEKLLSHGADAHDKILPLALERAVRTLFAVHEQHSDAS